MYQRRSELVLRGGSTTFRNFDLEEVLSQRPPADGSVLTAEFFQSPPAGRPAYSIPPKGTGTKESWCDEDGGRKAAFGQLFHTHSDRAAVRVVERDRDAWASFRKVRAIQHRLERDHLKVLKEDV
jgi:hypothetical protein